MERERRGKLCCSRAGRGTQLTKSAPPPLPLSSSYVPCFCLLFVMVSHRYPLRYSFFAFSCLCSHLRFPLCAFACCCCESHIMFIVVFSSVFLSCISSLLFCVVLFSFSAYIFFVFSVFSRVISLFSHICVLGIFLRLKWVLHYKLPFFFSSSSCSSVFLSSSHILSDFVPTSFSLFLSFC